MMKGKRFAAILAAALLSFALIFSLFFVVSESDHDCSGEHCAICHQLQICQTLLEQLSTAHAVFVRVGGLCFFALLLVLGVQRALFVITPVSLRVKLLN